MNAALVSISGNGPMIQTNNASLSAPPSEVTPSHAAMQTNAAHVTNGSALDTAMALLSGPFRQISGYVQRR